LDFFKNFLKNLNFLELFAWKNRNFLVKLPEEIEIFLKKSTFVSEIA